MAKAIVFEYTRPASIVIDKALLRATLEDVRDQLLSHDINGGPRQLSMNTVCQLADESNNKCGTAACIGGWASLFLLGFEGHTEVERNTVNELFAKLTDDDLGGKYLYNLFYEYGAVENFDEPNVAATAIQRYLDGKKPWPESRFDSVTMPNVLPYTKRAKAPKKR